MKREKIAVIGTGMMGMSLAALFTGNGYDTKVFATKECSADRGCRSYEEIYAVLQSRGLVTGEQAALCRKNLRFVFTYQDLADCTVFFECAVENMEIKHGIYCQIAENCPACQVIASTSSAMAPGDLCHCVPGAEKIVVTHPFNPPHLVPFVEMVKSPCTSEEAAQLVYDVLEDCGRKVCVMQKSAPGFIANRLQHALLREAIYMVEQGMASPRDIDKALMYSFMPRYTSVGLFEHQDAAGLDMVQSIENYLFPSLCDRKSAFPYVNERVATGTMGQKNGCGTYTWDAESIADFKKRASEPYWKYFNWRLPETET
ncbi:3-hydroxyacyl-CoA dehydrogenase family protein [Dysosmobacter sp.]